MLTYRTFCNSDPPVLTSIWRSRRRQRGLLDRVSPDLLEQLVFAKLYFDYSGLILADEGGRVVGFAHAGFGPNDAENRISTDFGVICMLMVRPDCAEVEVAQGLLKHCEAYLRDRGAKVLYGGGIQPLNPFYLGLYGGSELPGVLASDRVAQEAFASCGYRVIDRTIILDCNLEGFQAVIDRNQMQIRRRMVVEVTVDPPPRTWWEACTIGDFDLTRFELVPRAGGAAVAQATFRSMEPPGGAGVGRAAGLIDLHVDAFLRRRGLAVFLLSEAFRQFVRQGVMLIEAQAMEHNTAVLGLYNKLGFRQVDQGSVFRKDAEGS